MHAAREIDSYKIFNAKFTTIGYGTTADVLCLRAGESATSKREERLIQS
jgi:hypothetical protein